MKKIIALLILFPCLLAAQAKPEKKPAGNKNTTHKVKEDVTKQTVLTAKDFVTKPDGIYYNRQTIRLNDGSQKPIEVTFVFFATPEKYKGLGLDGINFIIDTSNYRTMLDIDNQSTYEPKKLWLIYDEVKHDWTCGIEYTYENDYGGFETATVYYTYDEEGNLTSAIEEK